MAELLLDKGYEVHGVIRRASSFNTARIDHCLDVSRAYEKFGFRAHTPLEDGLKRTVEWYEESAKRATASAF